MQRLHETDNTFKLKLNPRLGTDSLSINIHKCLHTLTINLTWNILMCLKGNKGYNTLLFFYTIKSSFILGARKLTPVTIWKNKHYPSCYNVKYLDVIFNYNTFIIDLSADFPSIEGITCLNLSKTRYLEMWKNVCTD